MGGTVSSNNYSQPRPKAGNVSIGDVSISQAIKKEYKRFNLCDNMENWDAVPTVKKTINAYKFFIVPLVNGGLVPNPLEMDKWNKRFTRSYEAAITDTAGNVTKTSLLPVSRPNGKKAYIHGLTYAAYDFNQMIPQLTNANIQQAATLMGRTVYAHAAETLASLVEPDAFGVGLPGLIISSDVKTRVPRSGQYTTASYPLPNWYNINPGNATTAANNRVDRRRTDLEVMQVLNQTAPRASVFHGMLPADYGYNNVAISIIGNRAGGNVRLWDSQGRYNATDNNQTNSCPGDIIFPAINNDIDVLIPDDITEITVEAHGLAWAHHLDFPDTDDNTCATDPYVKGAHAERNMVTYVNMPLKIQLDIRYNEI